MAVVVRGKTECALCAEVIATGDDIFSTSAFVEDPGHELWRFSDAAMHQSCFLAWPRGEAFVELFNRYYAQHYRGMRFMRPDGTIEDRDPQPRRPV